MSHTFLLFSLSFPYPSLPPSILFTLSLSLPLSFSLLPPSLILTLSPFFSLPLSPSLSSLLLSSPLPPQGKSDSGVPRDGVDSDVENVILADPYFQDPQLKPNISGKHLPVCQLDQSVSLVRGLHCISRNQ